VVVVFVMVAMVATTARISLHFHLNLHALLIAILF
jgi:hypothetical protein